MSQRKGSSFMTGWHVKSWLPKSLDSCKPVLWCWVNFYDPLPSSFPLENGEVGSEDIYLEGFCKKWAYCKNMYSSGQIEFHLCLRGFVSYVPDPNFTI